MPENKPIPVLRRESEASQNLKQSPSEHTRPLMMFEVKAGDRYHVSLGDFTRDNPPVGFSLEIAPDESKNVTAQITELSAEYNAYELTLHVTNNNDQTVSVDVQELMGRV